MKYPHHPIACIFPMLPQKELQSLADDIRANGVCHPGTLYQGQVLDGRNRQAACEIAGVEMIWEDCDLMEQDSAEKFDPLKFVLSENLSRRHLKQSQRALIAARMANLPQGKKKDISIDISQDDSAAMLSVGVASVRRAKHVLDNGDESLIAAMESGGVTVNMAEKLCKACPDKNEQARLVSEGKAAIREFLSPPDGDGLPADPDDDEDDTYDHPAFESFKHADYRLNTLKKILDSLAPHERELVKDWIQ